MALRAHALWPDGQDSASADAVRVSGSAGNLVYVAAGDALFQQEVIANITRALDIPWTQTYCVDAFEQVDDSCTTATCTSSGRILSKVRRIGEKGRRLPSRIPQPAVRNLIVIDHLERFRGESVLELDFFFGATGSSSPDSLISRTIFLLSLDPVELSVTADLDGDGAISVSELKTHLSTQLNSPAHNFNGDAFVGRVSRFATQQSAGASVEGAISTCAFVRARRQDAFQAQQAPGGIESVPFSTVLALVSIPVILFYMWKRATRRKRVILRRVCNETEPSEDEDESASAGGEGEEPAEEAAPVTPGNDHDEDDNEDLNDDAPASTDTGSGSCTGDANYADHIDRLHYPPSTTPETGPAVQGANRRNRAPLEAAPRDAPEETPAQSEPLPVGVRTRAQRAKESARTGAGTGRGGR